jgi:2-dehydro-3-deoxygluconokinase
MSAVLCVGEALISLTPPAGTSLLGSSELLIWPGGAEVNVAVHLARLGVTTRFAGRVGADPFGARLRRSLDEAGVDTRFLEEDPDRPTGIYLKDANGVATTVWYYRHGSAATEYGHVPDEALAGVAHVHLTGITPALSDRCRDLVQDLMALPSLQVSFDVNYRPALWRSASAAESLMLLARQAHTVFVGLDEAGAVWGCQTPEGVRSLLPEPTELVVKDGPRPAVAFVGEEVIRVPAPEIEVVEPVGAGDAFAAGYLAARHFGHDPRKAMLWGHLLASSVLQVLGDHGAVPDRGFLENAAAEEGLEYVVD